MLFSTLHSLEVYLNISRYQNLLRRSSCRFDRLSSTNRNTRTLRLPTNRTLRCLQLCPLQLKSPSLLIGRLDWRHSQLGELHEDPNRSSSSEKGPLLFSLTQRAPKVNLSTVILHISNSIVYSVCLTFVT